MHEVLAVILLLPLGALVTAFVRTIIGLRTFGTFTPTLLALAFVYNDWRTGIVVFLAVMVLGFSSRTLLDRLKLLLVPRLGIILTLVVLCIVFSISVLDYFELHARRPGRAAADGDPDDARGAVLRDDRGRQPALSPCNCWSARWPWPSSSMPCCGGRRWARRLLFYPELHLFTVAALILVGRYTGYRWTELWRFRDLPGGNRAVQEPCHVRVGTAALGHAAGTPPRGRAGHQSPQRRVRAAQQSPPLLSPRRRQVPHQADLPPAADSRARRPMR